MVGFMDTEYYPTKIRRWFIQGSLYKGNHMDRVQKVIKMAQHFMEILWKGKNKGKELIPGQNNQECREKNIQDILKME